MTSDFLDTALLSSLSSALQLTSSLSRLSHSFQCTICKGPFLADLPSQHKLHVDAKHPKSTPDVCFPPEALAACIAAAATSKPVAQKK